MIEKPNKVYVPKEEVIKITDIPEPEFSMQYTDINVKLLKYICLLCRSTFEYKEFIQILKNYLNVDRCAYYEGYSMKNGFTIEVHHSPLTLFDYCETVANKQFKEKNYIETFKVAEEVIKLHFEFKVGLVPLNGTAHELVHSDMLKVHPHLVIGNWKLFMDEYNEHLSEDVRIKLMEAIEYEKEQDPTKFPKILERSEVKLDIKGLPSIIKMDVDKLLINSKMKLLEGK